MAGQNLIVSMFVLLLLASSSTATDISTNESSIYNVLDFGAIGDGNTNDTLAFVNAWSAACHNSTARSTLIIPAGKTFLLSRINFEGPCNNFIYVALDGNLKRTNEIWQEGFSWLLFIQINGINITGSGELDGQGTDWWSCKEKKKCPDDAPNSLHMMSCTDAQIGGLRLINSTMMHVSVAKSERVGISNITIIAPEDSPNTDGIHVQESKFVNISNSIIGTGDDCVSLSEGAEDITIRNVTCGPGHGISIGSLGKKGSRATASNIHVSNCTLTQTTNGVRIKTWQGGSGFARNISFVNITMNGVTHPIIIDQYYCPNSVCDVHESAVEVIDVKYIGVTGSSSRDVAVALNCSQSVPCNGIVMDSVNLWHANEGEEVQSHCINANGSARNQVTPAVSCLTQGNLAS
ncbi:polygalacturonase ADPG1-like [Zingiber officinale]|uniref:polygalacturonase ADPG1-like n=1 Tax=Zingiber officinale TaxID=94328 RepID=UPI001C4BB249|nr:polygalacturonase ADPG1-like [Zingiber officinale]